MFRELYGKGEMKFQIKGGEKKGYSWLNNLRNMENTVGDSE